MTKLGAVTLLTPTSTWDIQYLSQLLHLTSLGMAFLEPGLSALVKLEHLSVRATHARCYAEDRHSSTHADKCQEFGLRCHSVAAGAKLDCVGYSHRPHYVLGIQQRGLD